MHDELNKEGFSSFQLVAQRRFIVPPSSITFISSLFDPSSCSHSVPSSLFRNVGFQGHIIEKSYSPSQGSLLTYELNGQTIAKVLLALLISSSSH